MGMLEENWDDVGWAIDRLLPQLKSEHPAAALAVAAKADVLESRLSSFLAQTEGTPEADIEAAPEDGEHQT